MMKKLSFAIAAGMLLAGTARAAEGGTAHVPDVKLDKTQPHDTDQPGAPDPGDDRTSTPTSAGIGAKVKVLAQDQTKGDATNGIGAQVRELARQHGCDQNGSAECKAHEAVLGALAEKAGAPAEKPSLPGEAAERTAARTGTKEQATEVERAALRHTGRAVTGKDVDDMHSNAHRAGHGDGHGMGDSMMGAETKRSGDAHPMGTSGMGTMGPSGRMP